MPAFPLPSGISLYKLGGKATLVGVAGTSAEQSWPFLSRCSSNKSYILLACAVLRWVFVPSLSSSIQSLRGLTSVFLNLYSF